MARLFFALWPDPAAREALAGIASELAAASGGRAVPAAKIHLTLAFLGEVEEPRVERAIECGQRAGFAPVRIALDCVGSFRRARVAWAGSVAADAAVATLQARLAQALRAEGFELEERPFTPHVTLARRTARAVPGAPIVPIAWTAQAMALVVSRPNGSYANLAEFGKG